MPLLEDMQKFHKLQQVYKEGMDHLQFKKAKAQKISGPSLDGMPHAKGQRYSRIESAAVQVVEMEEELLKLYKDLLRRKADIIRQINAFESAKVRLIMKYRLDGDTWCDVADKMGMGEYQVKKAYYRALEDVKNE